MKTTHIWLFYFVLGQIRSNTQQTSKVNQKNYICQNPRKQCYEINCLVTGKVSKDAKTSISSNPHFAHLCSQITHENTIICNVLRVFFNVECVKKWHSKQNHSDCGLPFTHPTLRTLCVQLFAKSIYTHFACCVVCAIVMPSANMLTEISRTFFCFAWSLTDQKV